MVYTNAIYLVVAAFLAAQSAEALPTGSVFETIAKGGDVGPSLALPPANQKREAEAFHNGNGGALQLKPGATIFDPSPFINKKREPEARKGGFGSGFENGLDIIGGLGGSGSGGPDGVLLSKREPEARKGGFGSGFENGLDIIGGLGGSGSGGPDGVLLSKREPEAFYNEDAQTEAI